MIMILTKEIVNHRQLLLSFNQLFFKKGKKGKKDKQGILHEAKSRKTRKFCLKEGFLRKILQIKKGLRNEVVWLREG